MKVDYMDMKMRPIDHKNLEQGSDFMMVVKVTNNTFTEIDNIALTQMVPSGWEIQKHETLRSTMESEKASTITAISEMTGYILIFFEQGETKTFVLILNAAYKGEFYQPSVFCEACINRIAFQDIPEIG